jgi:hypothetical protein
MIRKQINTIVLRVLWLFLAMEIMVAVARPDVIYRQIFANQTGEWKSTAQLGTDWKEWLVYGAYAPSGFVNVGITPREGLSSNDSNIGAALPAGGANVTEGALVTYNGSNAILLAYTTALTIKPADYSKITFSWLQKTANPEGAYTRLVVCVGGKWYMSSQNMTSSAKGEMETKTCVFSSAASNWYLLVNAEVINATNLRFHTEIAELTKSPDTDLNGPITGFGIILVTGSPSSMLVDSFSVDVTSK